MHLWAAVGHLMPVIGYHSLDSRITISSKAEERRETRCSLS